MNFQRLPPAQDLHYPGPLNFSTSVSLPSIASNGTYNRETPSQVRSEATLVSTSPTPLTSELTTLSLKTPLCPLCKGQKYGFTAYFHNTKIFSEPPHELLPAIEKAYILKNRLKSLLVTYIMRELEHEGVQEALKEVLTWNQLVGDLLSEVEAFQGACEDGFRSLGEVRNWTREMTRQIRESLSGRRKLNIPKGRLRILLLEFRKLWEGVWKQCLLDGKKDGSSREQVEMEGGYNSVERSCGSE